MKTDMNFCNIQSKDKVSHFDQFSVIDADEHP